MTTVIIDNINSEQHENTIQEEKNEAEKQTMKENEMFPCTHPKCGKTFFSSSQLETHMCIHSKEKSLVSDSKNFHKVLTDTKNSQEPKKIHTEVKGIHKCKLCGMTFTTSCNLTKHSKNLHNKDDSKRVQKRTTICEVFIEENAEKSKRYRCAYPGCKFRFARPSKLERHMCKHTGERQFVCDYEDCDKAYTNACHLKRHKMSHTGVKETFPCTLCGMKFTEPHNLKRHHKRLHENPLGRIYKYPKICEVCLAEFPTRTLLRSHVLEIHERKLYRCELCPKSFSEPSVLQNHLKTSVHNKNKRCNICSLSFAKELDLRQHHRQEHRESYSEYTCNNCDKKFSSKRNIRYHMRNHLTEDFVACTVEGCTRIYLFQRNLDQHVRTFHLNQKFECASCSAKLSTNQKLKEHIQRIHENPKAKKQPPTKDKRKRRHDLGEYKKSAASELAGLLLPPKLEKEILHRQVIKL